MISGFKILNVILCACTISAVRQRRRASGATVLTPADGIEYVRALSTINRFCPVRCASEIVQPSSTSQLAAWIRSNVGTPFTVKGGGHSYGCQSVPKDGGVLIHTGRLNQAEVFKRSDGSAFLRTGTGLTFDQVVPRLHKMGYSMPHGECITVGLAGWNLNVGQHPELKNFDNEWGYKESGGAFLSKVTFVDYAGTIFTVDKDGLHLVELGKSSRLAWNAKVAYTKQLAAAVFVGTVWGKDNHIVSVGNIMRVFTIWGASLAIATEMEIELIPKQEPGFFSVVYSVSDVLDEAGNKGKQLMQALYDVVAHKNTDNGKKVDCGIFYGSEYFKGTKEGAISLKCADWGSRKGENIKRLAPPGYRHIKPKKSGFLFWSKNSYGQGWVPVWHAEPRDKFEEVGGPEKYRDYIRALERGDSSGPNPCDGCSSELMYVFKPNSAPHIMFDNLCSASKANQESCTAFILKIKGAFNGDRYVKYKQNLPSCAANREWNSQVAEYGTAGGIVAGQLKGSWDTKKVVDFWLGVGHKSNGDACDAAKVEQVGETCQKHGITDEDLVQAELDYVRQKCPSFERYDDFDSRDNLCLEHIYNVSTPLQLTVL